MQMRLGTRNYLLCFFKYLQIVFYICISFFDKSWNREACKTRKGDLLKVVDVHF